MTGYTPATSIKISFRKYLAYLYSYFLWLAGAEGLHCKIRMKFDEIFFKKHRSLSAWEKIHKGAEISRAN